MILDLEGLRLKLNEKLRGVSQHLEILLNETRIHLVYVCMKSSESGESLVHSTFIKLFEIEAADIICFLFCNA